MAKVGILGPSSGLFISILQKLIRSDYGFYTSSEALKILEQSDKALLDYCINPPGSIGDDVDFLFLIGEQNIEQMPSSVGCLVKISNYDSGDAIDADCEIRIKDMIPSTFGDKLAGQKLNELVSEDIETNHNQENWWVGEVDVVEAICSLVRRPELLSGIPEIVISGRRSWKVTDIHSELKLLNARTLDGRSGKFKVSSLVSPTPDNIHLEELQSGIEKVESLPSLTDVSVKPITAPSRPDLGVLHDLLKEVNGEGWRQTQPVRQALMIYLASYFDTQRV